MSAHCCDLTLLSVCDALWQCRLLLADVTPMSHALFPFDFIWQAPFAQEEIAPQWIFITVFCGFYAVCVKHWGFCSAFGVCARTEFKRKSNIAAGLEVIFTLPAGTTCSSAFDTWSQRSLGDWQIKRHRGWKRYVCKLLSW